MYGDGREDMYCELEAVHDNVGVFHFSDSVRRSAMEEELRVVCSIKGEEFEEVVAPIDTADPLTKKTKVNVGDKIEIDNFFEFEVIDCAEKNYLLASNTAEAEQYEAFGDRKFVDLVLKVKNNSQSDLNDIVGYTITKDKTYDSRAEIEIENNTDFEDLDEAPLKPGEEEYIHVYAAVDSYVYTDKLVFRFNLLGNCYYCEVE